MSHRTTMQIRQVSSYYGAMGTRRYLHLSYPWNAFWDSRSAPPARFYAALMNQALRHNMPAKRFGRIGAKIIVHGVPTGGLTAVSRIRPRRAQADLDGLLDDVASAWPALAERSVRLPPSPPELSALALARSAAQTVFIFEPAGVRCSFVRCPEGVPPG